MRGGVDWEEVWAKPPQSVGERECCTPPFEPPPGIEPGWHPYEGWSVSQTLVANWR